MNLGKVTYCLILSLITILFSGCNTEDSDGSVYCSDGCLSEKPDSAKLIIKLTINAENPTIPITIYQDKFSLDTTIRVIYQGFIDSSEFKYIVKTNEYYSVKAQYKSGTRTIFAIDGGTFKAENPETCDNICWQILGGIYDLRIKNY